VSPTIAHWHFTEALDILVNNAGWNIGIPFRKLDALTPEIWEIGFSKQTFAGRFCSHVVLPLSFSGTKPVAS
jgi:hypothetical protein